MNQVSWRPTSHGGRTHCMDAKQVICVSLRQCTTRNVVGVGGVARAIPGEKSGGSPLFNNFLMW